MSLENAEVIDAAGIEKVSGFVALTIADAWDWTDERRHLLALQAKLNAYFKFVETGQIWESYPDAVGRQIVIDVVGRYPLPQIAIDFLNLASDACTDLGVTVRHRHYPGPSQDTAEP